MAKQILISQGDYGILFNVTILDETNKPIIVGSDNIKFYVITPSGNKIEVNDVSIIDENTGIVEFELDKEHTQEAGNHQIYVEISSPTFEVTSVLAENYYIMEEHGGA